MADPAQWVCAATLFLFGLSDVFFCDVNSIEVKTSRSNAEVFSTDASWPSCFAAEADAPEWTCTTFPLEILWRLPGHCGLTPHVDSASFRHKVECSAGPRFLHTWNRSHENQSFGKKNSVCRGLFLRSFMLGRNR